MQFSKAIIYGIITRRDRHAREKFRGHPYFDRTAELCHKWDRESFEPIIWTVEFVKNVQISLEF
jgi:predicted HD phosphohydrolase